jgi:predicted MFS family arabinose efflux permease
MTVFFIDIVALLLAAWSPDIHFLMAASFLIGAFSIIPQLIIPMAAHLSAPEQRGKTIGFVMSGLLIGILLSRTVSGYVGAHLGWRAMFLIAAILMVVLAITLYFLLPEVYPDYKGSYKELMTSLISLIKEEPILRVASIRGALCFAGFAGFWTTLVFLLREPQFHAGSEVAGAFGLVGAFGALAASQMGRLSDKGNGHRLTAISILLVIVSFIVFGFSTNSLVGLVIGVIIMDMGVQATHISNQAVIFSIRPEARNRLNTVYMVTYFIGGALGTFLASQCWNRYHWNGVVAMGLILSTVALLLHLFFKQPLTQKNDPL